MNIFLVSTKKLTTKLNIETVIPNIDLSLTQDRYWNIHTYQVSDLKKFVLRSIDNIKSPSRVFKSAEEQFHDDCISEVHRKSYGRPWSLGHHFFDFLMTQEIKPNTKILDFGCGSGRLGIHLIDYLDNGNYYGIDSHVNSLMAFADYEIPKANLEDKSPRLLLDDNFQFDYFKTKFDLVVETSVTQHILDNGHKLKAYRNIAGVLKRGGKYVVTPQLNNSTTQQLNPLGLKLSEQVTSYFENFTSTKYEGKTYWSIFQKT